MRLILLGLKDKQNNYYVYNYHTTPRHTPITLKETKEIEVLSPFPFNHFSSLDSFDKNKFEKCYLEVEAEFDESEFMNMKSSGLVYYQFFKRKITFIGEFFNIFQYCLETLKKTKNNLGTYDLTTWIIHEGTHNALEFDAMKSILTRAVSENDNKKYALDISLTENSFPYMEHLYDLEKRGYNITIGRYGRTDTKILHKKTKNVLTEKTLLFLMKKLHSIEDSFFSLDLFTKEFFKNHLEGTDFGYNLLRYAEKKDLQALKNKGFDLDELYQFIYYRTLEEINREFWEHKDVFEAFASEDMQPYMQTFSPLDNYCCEDCDGYDIYEDYDEEELKGHEEEVDERPYYVEKLVGFWGDFLTEKSHHLFEKVPTDVLGKVPRKICLEMFKKRQKV